MPGPLKGPGKFWNIDPIWRYVLLILATNCAFQFSLYFQFDQTFLTPHLLLKTVWSPPPWQLKTFLAPSILPSPPPHQGIYEHSLNAHLLSGHTTIGQTQVDFVDFHRWFETNSWILMSHMSFDMTSFSFRLRCPISRYCRPTLAITVLWCFIGVCWNAPLVTVFH